MRKEIVCYILIGLLVTTSIIPTTIGFIDEKTNKTTPLISISEDITIGTENTVTEDLYNYPVMIDPPDLSNLENASPKPSIIETPSEFSWKNYNNQDWTSPVKRQHCGDCWCFAAIGCLESIINIREGYADLDPDLSEQYVLSCLPESGGCKGGSAELAFRYMIEETPSGNYHNGALLETCFPYIGIDANGCDYYTCNNDPVPCSDKCDDWENNLVPILDFDYWYSDGSANDIQRIKSQIIQDGPVVTSMYADNDFKKWTATHHNSEDYYPYTGSTKYYNHQVDIIGWKDDPSIGRGGYWICKNSWGKFSGYGGYFNIEYGSLNIDRGGIASVDYDPNSFDWSPIANAGGPYAGSIGETITFDASKSFDPEDNIISYEWDFGDGKIEYGIHPSHTYLEKGIYDIKLKVIDESGKQGTTETYAIIDLWDKGDSWTYNIDNININLNKDKEDILSIQGSIKNLILTITDDLDEYYQIDFTGKLIGDFKIISNIGTLSGDTPRDIHVDGNIVIKKSDLGIKETNIHIKGLLKLDSDILPIKIPIPFDINTNIRFDKTLKIINFPLHINKIWDIPSTSISIDGEIKSIMLNILNFINMITGRSLLPPEISKLLPIIDIEEALETFNIETPIITPVTPNVKCIDKREINVEAGTYNAYKINIPLLMDYYYAPAVGNIIKISMDIEDYTTSYGDLTFIIQGELISTNYEG